ncbi:hypothetical protein [Lonsdalea quercina]
MRSMTDGDTLTNVASDWRKKTRASQTAFTQGGFRGAEREN